MSIEPNRLDMMSAMWMKGCSLNEIATSFGVTKGVVSGLTGRNRDKFPVRRRGRKEIIRAPAPEAQPESGYFTFEDAKGKDRGDMSRFKLAGVEPVEFWKVGYGRCQFILDHISKISGPYSPCCGARAMEAKPWCEAHFGVVKRHD